MELSGEKLLGFVLQLYFQITKCIYKLFPNYLERTITSTFERFGIKIGGKEPWDIQVTNPNFYLRVALQPSLGLGESFMDGWWKPNDNKAFFYKLAKGMKKRKGKHGQRASSFSLKNFLYHTTFKLFNMSSKDRCWSVGEKHYDLGNDLYKSFLDSTMNYTCAYWPNGTKTLEEAQKNKMELIAQKLKLKPGMKVLDMGCGWGGLAIYLAKNHGVEVVGCTISKEQVELAQEKCVGLPVHIKLMDYRDVQGEQIFDRVVSVGLCEHVGATNYSTFFQLASKVLKEDGLFLLHSIGVSQSHIKLVDPWTDRYIFPNGILPYHTDITKYTNDLFVLEDWHNIGFDYSLTLEAWIDNFKRSWPDLKHRFDQRFYKMWIYYLYMAAAMFAERKLQLWQVVLSKNGFPGGYRSVR